MSIRIVNTQTGQTFTPKPGDPKSVPLAIWDAIDRPQSELSKKMGVSK